MPSELGGLAETFLRRLDEDDVVGRHVSRDPAEFSHDLVHAVHEALLLDPRRGSLCLRVVATLLHEPYRKGDDDCGHDDDGYSEKDGVEHRARLVSLIANVTPEPLHLHHLAALSDILVP